MTHATVDTQAANGRAAAQDSPAPATIGATPTEGSRGQTSGHARPPATPTAFPRGLSLTPPAMAEATPARFARGVSLTASQSSGDTHKLPAGGDLTPNQRSSDTQASFVGGEISLFDPGSNVHFLAEFLDDTEKVRIASENRLRSLALEYSEATNQPLDLKDNNGKPLKGRKLAEKITVELPQLGTYADQTLAMINIEHQAVLALQRAVRDHPLGWWIKDTVGIGEKQGGRLLAAIGDVRMNHLKNRPRHGPAELWAYCGFAPSQKRRKGVKHNWNANAKMRATLCANSCMKQRTSPYRPVYDVARANWAERPVSDLHKHNHAVRLVAKALLRDLWKAAQ